MNHKYIPAYNLVSLILHIWLILHPAFVTRGHPLTPPIGYNSSIYVKWYGSKSFSRILDLQVCALSSCTKPIASCLFPYHCTRCRFLFPGVSIDSSGRGLHPGNYPHPGASLSFWQWCCWRFSSDVTRCHVPEGCSCWMFMYPSVVTTPCIKYVCHSVWSHIAAGIFVTLLEVNSNQCTVPVWFSWPVMLTWLYVINYDMHSTAVNREKLETSCNVRDMCALQIGVHISPILVDQVRYV
jgi:hypothetical protein